MWRHVIEGNHKQPWRGKSDNGRIRISTSRCIRRTARYGYRTVIMGSVDGENYEDYEEGDDDDDNQ